MAAAVLTPGATTAMTINNAHVVLGNVHERAAQEIAKQLGTRRTGTMRPSQAKASRQAVSSHTAPASSQPLELLYDDLFGLMPECRGKAKFILLVLDDYSGAFPGGQATTTVARSFQAFLTAIKPLRKRFATPGIEMRGASRSDNGIGFSTGSSPTSWRSTTSRGTSPLLIIWSVT